MTLAGNVGNILNWETSTDGGSTWNTTANTSNTEPYVGLTQSTLYRVIVQNASCEPDTSNIDAVNVFPQTVAGTITGPVNVCEGVNTGGLLLTGHIGDVLDWITSIDNGLTWVSTSNTKYKSTLF